MSILFTFSPLGSFLHFQTHAENVVHYAIVHSWKHHFFPADWWLIQFPFRMLLINIFNVSFLQPTFSIRLDLFHWETFSFMAILMGRSLLGSQRKFIHSFSWERKERFSVSIMRLSTNNNSTVFLLNLPRMGFHGIWAECYGRFGVMVASTS